MRTCVISVSLAVFLAIGFCGCGGGPASISDADAVKEREKMKGEVEKGNIPTGMPQEVMKKNNYPGMDSEEAAKHGGGNPAQNTTNADLYKKK